MNIKKQASAQCNSEQNRLKLIQQNVKLNKQIRILQQKMSSVIQFDTRNAVEEDKKKNQVKVKFNQITLQQSYIKKLKNKLKDLKALNILDVTKGIVNEQNQLLLMKKQYQKLCQQKKILNRKCDDKKNALQYNNPLNDFKSETQTQLAKIRRKNTQMSAKIVELQREIRKFHKYQQLNKKYKDQKIVIQNPEYQYSKIQHEKLNLLKKSKLVQQKWRPQIQSLDKQYFQSKQNFLRKDRAIKQLQKQLKNWQNRSTAVRNQADVLQDRQRLSKVIVMTSTKKQNIDQEKSPKKDLQNKKIQSGFADFFKSLFTRNKNQNDPQKIVKPIVNTSIELKQEKQQLRRWNNINGESNYGSKSQRVKGSEDLKHRFTKLSQKNQFIKSKHLFEDFDLNNPKSQVQKQLKNNKILTNSIAVGTSFYYNEDD